MYDGTTMCILHKGFSGFRALNLALNFGGKLRSFNFVIPYASYTQR